MFCRKGVLQSFVKFTGKHLCSPVHTCCIPTCNFIKKETLAQFFSSEFYEISKNTFSYRRPAVAAFRRHIVIFITHILKCCLSTVKLHDIFDTVYEYVLKMKMKNKTSLERSPQSYAEK